MASNNGEYTDTSGDAVRTDAIDLNTDFLKWGFQACYLVLDRIYVSSEKSEERFREELYMDQPDAIQVGEWRAWED
jgi:hypothetical protein